MNNEYNSWLVQHPTRSGTVNVVSEADYILAHRERVRLLEILRRQYFGMRAMTSDMSWFEMSEEDRERQFNDWVADQLVATW